MSFTLKTPEETLLEIAQRLKLKRLDANLTQQGLAARSGVSLGSIKRFEKTGEISLHSLLNIALTLNCIDDFDQLFQQNDVPKTLFENSNSAPPRKRGSIK